jgi:ABC-type Zn uptake system ZnuABC Zn-binding protein ZnuA
MSGTIKFVLLGLLLIIIFGTACGVQSEQVTAQSNSQAETHGNAVELSAVDLAEGEKLKVVATTNIIGDLVRNVGGDMIELITLLPVGSDPHTFAPAPQDAASVANAHVVFINGLHLEEFLEELIENAGGQAPIVTVSKNVETRELEEIDEHNHKGVDPHVWMSPANAMVMVHNIERALTQLDPANAKSYKENAETYEAQLEELDRWVEAQIESIPAENRILVSDHDSLGYYVDRYGLEVVGAVIPAISTNAEPSAHELAGLQQEISELNVKAVFVGTTVNSALSQRVAQDTGIQMIPLYTGSLGKAGSGAETYVDFMRYNTTAIVGGLK